MYLIEAVNDGVRARIKSVGRLHAAKMTVDHVNKVDNGLAGVIHVEDGGICVHAYGVELVRIHHSQPAKILEVFR